MDQATKLADRRMQELAQEPGVTVLEYAYDAQERQATPEVACQLARDAFLLRRRSYSGLDDANAAAAVAASSETLATFSRSHPRIFANVTKADGGAEALQTLEKLARVRLQVASEEEALVHVNRIIMERTMRPMTDDEKAAAAAPPPTNARRSPPPAERILDAQGPFQSP